MTTETPSNLLRKISQSWNRTPLIGKISYIFVAISLVELGAVCNYTDTQRQELRRQQNLTRDVYPTLTPEIYDPRINGAANRGRHTTIP